MSINQIIIDIMAVFMAIGGIDRITHGKLKLGLSESFEEGFNALGALALSMLGILSLAPVLAKGMQAVMGPIYGIIGADPAMFAGSILACDMGAYHIALGMAGSHEAACFSGLILGSMLGTVIVFTIPVGLGLINKEDRPYMAKGILYGIVTIPIGCLLGGLAAGYDIRFIIINTLPALVFSILIAIGIWRIPNGMIKGFDILGKIIISIITFGLVTAVFQKLTGLTIISGMAPLEDGFKIIGNIAVILAGAYVMVRVIVRVLNKPLTKAGTLIGVNASSMAGLIASLANAIPMFGIMHEMNERGKILNGAFAVSGAFIFGDHLAFTASVEPSLIVPVIIAKASAAISAVILAILAQSKASHSAN